MLAYFRCSGFVFQVKLRPEQLVNISFVNVRVKKKTVEYRKQKRGGMGDGGVREVNSSARLVASHFYRGRVTPF